MSRYTILIGGLTITLLIGIGVILAQRAEPAEAEAPEEEAAVTTTIETTTTPPPGSSSSTNAPSSTSSPSTSTTFATTTTALETSTTEPPTTTTAPTTTTGPPPPPFEASVSTPSESQLHASWRPGCPVGPSELRVISMTHWNYDGRVQSGQLVVAAALAEQVIAIFGDLYEAEYPIQRMEPIEAYGGDDDSSMAANNTSAFNCRQVTGGTTFSEHSYGRAIDLNPLVNPYVRGSTVLPPAGRQYADRSLDAAGMIHAGDEVVTAFGGRGWIWGGTWSSLKDYQHFSTTGR